jgi:2-polyprenyl-3-methyl-5-hydroxy-6-metoxy-1,4-benzoquinol methylase
MAVFRDIFAEKVDQCSDCGFVYTNPRLSAKMLETYYSKMYLLEGLDVPKSLKEFLGDRHKEIWFSKERDLGLVLGAKSEGRLLDIGCASGTLLWMAKNKGFKVKGVEVGRKPAEFAKNELGLDVFCGQAEEACFQDREFDVVTMIHSLEHVPDPRRVLKEIHRILRDDGIFIAVVPNLESWSAQKNGINWMWLQPQNHYSHFTPETLSEMASREGFIPKIISEEGRYGEEAIRAFFGPEGIQQLHSERKGSEIILLGHKKSAYAELPVVGCP